MQPKRKGTVAAFLLGAILAAAPLTALAEPDAFMDELITNSGSLDIGERTAFSPVSPPIPATASINGPVTVGKVKGQFDFACGTQTGCLTTADAAAALNWKWGVLQVSSYSPTPGSLTAQFVDVGGSDLFNSDLVTDEGFTSIEPQGFDGNPFTRLAHIEFNLEGAGVILQPGYSYVIFALLSEFPIGNRVPGEGLGPLNQAEESIFTSAFWDGPPFQFHQAFPVFDPDQNINQLATSRLIPVTPEPAGCLLAGLAGLCLIGKRGRISRSI